MSRFSKTLVVLLIALLLVPGAAMAQGGEGSAAPPYWEVVVTHGATQSPGWYTDTIGDALDAMVGAVPLLARTSDGNSIRWAGWLVEGWYNNALPETHSYDGGYLFLLRGDRTLIGNCDLRLIAEPLTAPYDPVLWFAICL